MAEADPAQASKPHYLAEWTRLSDDDLKACYVSCYARGRAHAWSALVGLAPPSLRLRVFEEADRHGFLEALALAVANWETEADRPANDLAAMLTRVCGSGVLQAIVDPAKGFRNAQILLPLLLASQACAIVFRTLPAVKQVGTAFLVRPDLVLTAAHVVMDVAVAANGSTAWGGSLVSGLEFHFQPRPGEGASARVVRPSAANALVATSEPHGEPPDVLEPSLDPPAGRYLDYALIRLAERVEHVSPVALSDSVAVAKGKECYAFGYPGGSALVYGNDLVTEVHDAAGRWLHRANAEHGMSGGCCINHEGEVAGLHEGAIRMHTATGEVEVVNRSVSIAAIRRAQRAGRRDPLEDAASTDGLDFADPELVAELYRAGLRLGGPGLEATWRDLVAAAVGVDPELGPLPPFHPWFTRDALETWIAGGKPAQRLCVVHGESGTGKSFCARILRERLDPAGTDLLHLTATQTGAMTWSDAISGALFAEDQRYRTAAASVRYDDTEAVAADLRRRSRDRNRIRWLALDFGPYSAGRDLAGAGWFSLISTLLLNDWVRILAIDLDESERLALEDLVFSRPQTTDLNWLDVRLDHVTRPELGRYALRLAQAKGKEMDAAAARAAAYEQLPDLTQSVAARPLQTAAAALAAIALESDWR